MNIRTLFLDSIYIDGAKGAAARFRWIKAPTSDEFTHLDQTLARRIGRFLERQGLLERDVEDCHLASAEITTLMPAWT